MNKTALYGWVLSAMVTTQLLSPQASARTVTNAKISDIKVGYFGETKVAVTVTGGTTAGSIGCTPSSGFGSTFIFDTGAVSGKTTLSVLLAAYLAGKTVDMYGASQCVNIILRGLSPETKTAEELGHSVVKN